MFFQGYFGILDILAWKKQRKKKKELPLLTQRNKNTGVSKMENIYPCRLAAMIEEGVSENTTWKILKHGTEGTWKIAFRTAKLKM